MSSSNYDIVKFCPQKLNRSASFSEMSPRKRFMLEKHMLSDSLNHTVYRHYSCEQICFTLSEGTQEVNVLRHCVSEIYIAKGDGKLEYGTGVEGNGKGEENITEARFGTDSTSNESTNKIKDEQFLSCMGDTKKDMQDPNSYLDKDYPKSNIRKITYSPPVSKHTCAKVCLCSFILIVLLLLILLSAWFVLFQTNCFMTFDISGVKSAMSSKLYGQQSAVEDIVSSLGSFYSSREPGLKVLIVTGATGVGKSYAMSILGELFPWQNNIHYWVMPIDAADVSYRSHNQFSSCGDNLVIVDSMLEENMRDAIQLAQFLTIISEQKRVIVVFVFNLHNQLSSETANDLNVRSINIKNKFNNVGINVNLISFQLLEREHVVQCIEESMAKKGIPFSNDRIEMVLKNLKSPNDGCKRVAGKVSLLTKSSKYEL